MLSVRRVLKSVRLSEAENELWVRDMSMALGHPVDGRADVAECIAAQREHIAALSELCHMQQQYLRMIEQILRTRKEAAHVDGKKG